MSGIQALRELVARLRVDCPWDRAQTHQSLRAYLMEELYEVLDALDTADDGRIEEELGDLLFQVLLHARLGEERGAFDIDSVARRIHDKMVERHPHVFADPSLPGGIADWEARKAARGGSRVQGVPRAMPALQRAHRVGEKVAHVGFDWPDIDGAWAKVEEEKRELLEAIASADPARIRHEYGDLLLSVSSLGRFLGLSGEDALREANIRFERRFRRVEALAAEAGVGLEAAGLERLEGWWTVAKAEETRCA